MHILLWISLTVAFGGLILAEDPTSNPEGNPEDNPGDVPDDLIQELRKATLTFEKTIKGTQSLKSGGNVVSPTVLNEKLIHARQSAIDIIMKFYCALIHQYYPHLCQLLDICYGHCPTGKSQLDIIPEDGINQENENGHSLTSPDKAIP